MTTYTSDAVAVRKIVALRKKGASWPTVYSTIGSDLAFRTFVSRARKFIKASDSASVVRSSYDRAARKAA